MYFGSTANLDHTARVAASLDVDELGTAPSPVAGNRARLASGRPSYPASGGAVPPRRDSAGRASAPTAGRPGTSPGCSTSAARRLPVWRSERSRIRGSTPERSRIRGSTPSAISTRPGSIPQRSARPARATISSSSPSPRAEPALPPRRVESSAGSRSCDPFHVLQRIAVRLPDAQVSKRSQNHARCLTTLPQLSRRGSVGASALVSRRGIQPRRLWQRPTSASCS